MVFNVWISELVKLHWENLSVLIMGCLDIYILLWHLNLTILVLRKPSCTRKDNLWMVHETTIGGCHIVL